jgi:acetylornithine/N-succinyldiaminopimelate aminotransferase
VTSTSIGLGGASFSTDRTTDQLVEVGRNTMARNFRQAPVVFIRGEGLFVWDRDGRRYLDFIGGLAVNGLGYSHPRIVDAATRQIRQLFHVSNLYFNKPQIELSEALSERYGDGRVFLCSSGTEANEAAIKLARRYATVVRKDSDRTGFVSFENSFHGRTIGALAATGQPKYHEGYEPLIPGFRYAKFNDFDSVESLVDDTTCAVIVEPIQAEGGLILAEPGFLAKVKQLCEDRGALLILDEVQTGETRHSDFSKSPWRRTPHRRNDFE